jgi:hypothetical protein
MSRQDRYYKYINKEYDSTLAHLMVYKDKL